MTQPLVPPTASANRSTSAGIVERLLQSDARAVRAVNDVSLAIRRGETLGLIGESGCGKTTLARVLLRLQEPTAGRITFDGADITALVATRDAALPPAHADHLPGPLRLAQPAPDGRAEIVGLPLRRSRELGKQARSRDRVVQMLERVGLAPAHLDRYPHQFSGGQRQRIGIARALIRQSDFVVCDEPVSALDVSIQAQIMLLLAELRELRPHLPVHLPRPRRRRPSQRPHRRDVSRRDRRERSGARGDRRPQHPYTQTLLAAVPRLDGTRRARGPPRPDPPSPIDRPPGCAFHRAARWRRTCAANGTCPRTHGPGRWPPAILSATAGQRIINRRLNAIQDENWSDTP